MLFEHGTHLAHPAESWQAWSVEAPLVGRGQHDEHLRDVSIAKTRILAGKVTSVGKQEHYLANSQPQSPWSFAASRCPSPTSSPCCRCP